MRSCVCLGKLPRVLGLFSSQSLQLLFFFLSSFVLLNCLVWGFFEGSTVEIDPVLLLFVTDIGNVRAAKSPGL